MKRWKQIRCASVFLLAFALILPACGQQSDHNSASGDKNITVMLDWLPNTNHTGLYVAQQKGYFAEEGLEVEIVTPGETSANELVGAGKAPFGISSQEYVTQARAQGVPVVSIAAVLQHNTSGFAAPKEKRIRSPKDFVGKTYGGWGTPIENAFIQTVLELDGVKTGNVEEKVRIVNIGQADFFTAVKRDIDFSWIYYGWTGIEAELREVPLDIIYLKDLDPVLDFYTPVIITNEEMLQKDPDTVKRFLRAVKKGYEYAIDHPGEAAEILIGAVPESDPELIRKSQQWISMQYRAESPAWGVQKEEIWAGFTDWMYKHRLIGKKIDSTEAFTNEFLPR